MGFLRKRSLFRRYVAYEPGPRRLAGIVVGCLHVTPTLAAGQNGGRGALSPNPIAEIVGNTA